MAPLWFPTWSEVAKELAKDAPEKETLLEHVAFVDEFGFLAVSPPIKSVGGNNQETIFFR